MPLSNHSVSDSPARFDWCWEDVESASTAPSKVSDELLERLSRVVSAPSKDERQEY